MPGWVAGPRTDFVAPILAALRDEGLVVVVGALDRGVRATSRTALEALGGFEVWELDGDGHAQGYLAGVEPVLLNLLAEAERKCPDLVARHEQTLKRVWPQRDSPAFELPRDLTGSASREERTRFYHQEYQNKLLVGLVEFALEVLVVTDRRVAILIERADRLPPTAKSLINVLCRLRTRPHSVVFALLDRSGSSQFGEAPQVFLPPLSKPEFDAAINSEAIGPTKRHLLFKRSDGDPELAMALMACLEKGKDLQSTDHLTANSIIDLYLASLSAKRRNELAADFVTSGLRGDPISQRNVATLPAGTLDELNFCAHAAALARYRAGQGPLVLAHALAIHDRFRQLEALVEPSEVLMSIGLYDTWFEYFAPMFSAPDLRSHGSGDDQVNGLFINAAFVLYAMGYATAALPFLEDFLERFPESRFIPTALYAQSMTYGRYQIPVDLPRAEHCALQNLSLINAKFAKHPRYTYIKVFAENAYAYITAKQGRFDEALALCETGITEIVDVYGADQFRLHRSILVYNTSQVYELVGDVVQAERRLQAAIDCDPYYAEYHNDMGNLLGRIPGRETEALHAYARAITLSPPYYEAHVNRGLLRAQLGDVNGAADDFRRALVIKPSEWRALRELGNLSLSAGDPAGALDAYDQALRHEAFDADLHANTGLAAAELGDSIRALHHAQAAVAINPKHAAARNNLAAELVMLGRPEDALEHAQLAVQYGNDPDFNANLIVIRNLCAKSCREKK